MKERKIPTTIQFGEKQLDSIDSILELHPERLSIAKFVRDAVDFYIDAKYPEYKN